MDLRQKWHIEDGLKELMDEVYEDDLKKATSLRCAVFDLCMIIKQLDTDRTHVYDWQIRELERVLRMMRDNVPNGKGIGEMIIPYGEPEGTTVEVKE